METKVCKECGRELPVESFKMSRFGSRVSVCTECANEKRRANAEEKKRKAVEEKKIALQKAKDTERELEKFSPRQLMKELSRRGYKGVLTFTQKIDITSF